MFLFFFSIYTGLTKMIFALFQSEEFEIPDGEIVKGIQMVSCAKHYGTCIRLLKSDYSIDYNGARQKEAQVFGIIMGLVYPIGWSNTIPRGTRC